MRFALSLLPCAGCGTRGEADLEFVGDRNRPVLSGNSRLDRATLFDCDLRGADLSLHTPGMLGTNAGTHFERCDLRGTQWTGRDLTGATFTDCRAGQQ